MLFKNYKIMLQPTNEIFMQSQNGLGENYNKLLRFVFVENVFGEWKWKKNERMVRMKKKEKVFG